MKHVLDDVLIDQKNLGNKGDRGWKMSALNVAAVVLSTNFNVNVTSDNVKKPYQIMEIMVWYCK